MGCLCLGLRGPHRGGAPRCDGLREFRGGSFRSRAVLPCPGTEKEALLVREAQERSERIIAEARAQSEEERRKARESSKEELATMVVLGVEKVLREKV